MTRSQQLDNQLIEIELKAGELVGKLLKLNQIEKNVITIKNQLLFTSSQMPISWRINKFQLNEINQFRKQENILIIPPEVDVINKCS